jgi:hypothetical protein
MRANLTKALQLVVFVLLDMFSIAFVGLLCVLVVWLLERLYPAY